MEQMFKILDQDHTLKQVLDHLEAAIATTSTTPSSSSSRRNMTDNSSSSSTNNKSSSVPPPPKQVVVTMQDIKHLVRVLRSIENQQQQQQQLQHQKGELTQEQKSDIFQQNQSSEDQQRVTIEVQQQKIVQLEGTVSALTAAVQVYKDQQQHMSAALAAQQNSARASANLDEQQLRSEHEKELEQLRSKLQQTSYDLARVREQQQTAVRGELHRKGEQHNHDDDNNSTRENMRQNGANIESSTAVVPKEHHMELLRRCNQFETRCSLLSQQIQSVPVSLNVAQAEKRVLEGKLERALVVHDNSVHKMKAEAERRERELHAFAAIQVSWFVHSTGTSASSA